MLRISRSRTYGARTPIDIVRAEGAWLWLADGRRILDFLSSAGALSLGHNHPRVLRAVAEARAAGLPTLALDFDTPPLHDFLVELEAVLPRPLRDDAIVHLCPPSGAAAVEAALTFAEFATGRSGFVAFDGGFHGCTRLARSVSSTGDMGMYPLTGVAGSAILPYPDAHTGYGQLRQPFADEAAISVVRGALGLDSPQRRPPAALIIECIQGESGGLAASGEFLRGVRAACSEADVVLVVDEVQAGIGRCGMMWSFEAVGVCPDVMILSKGLGGGFPIATVVGRADLDRWPAGAFTGTFRGVTDSFAAATATLRALSDLSLVTAARDLGVVLREMLEDAVADLDVVADLRGRGLLQGIQLRPVAGDAAALAADIRLDLLDHGLLVEIGGQADNIIRLIPPLTVTKGELELAVATLADVLHEVSMQPLAS